MGPRDLLTSGTRGAAYTGSSGGAVVSRFDRQGMASAMPQSCGINRALAPEACPSAAEAASHLFLGTARLKSCPDDLTQTETLPAVSKRALLGGAVATRCYDAVV